MKAGKTAAAAAIGAGLVLLMLPKASYGGEAPAVYKSKCAMCHGADGKGETPTGKALKLKDLGSAEVQKMSDAEVSDVITKGKGKMQAAKGVTPEQVKELVAFVRSLGKK